METDDELPIRRTATPLGRLDDQRAGFSSHAHVSTTVSSRAPSKPAHDPAPRPRRPSPKSAGSASLPALARYDSWENLPRPSDAYGRGQTRGGAQPRGGPSSKAIVEGELNVGGPFARSFGQNDWGWMNRSQVSSFSPRTPEPDARRRGSEVSTSSALSSYSPQSHTFPPMPSSAAASSKRHSVSSFGGHTIGDLSITSSMPLLRRQGTRDSHTGGSRSSSPSRSTATRQLSSAALSATAGGAATGRPNRDSGASFAYSETSSLHSYPPKPRQRTSSLSRSVTDNDYATGHILRRGSADSRTDVWPSFVGSNPVTKPSPSYQSTLSTYSFPAVPSSRTLGIPAPPSAYNPLTPLRKRLARSLSMTVGTRELHTEVQLLLELIDALEHCIATFAPPRTDFSGSRRASADSNVSGATGCDGLAAPSMAATSSLSSGPDTGEDNPLAPATSSTRSSTSTAGAGPGSGVATTRSAQLALVDEVRLLVREVVELVPAAQRCLTDGAYGPLASPAVSLSTRTLLEAFEHPSPRHLAVGPEWWPRKLVRDCRALLDEAGLPTGHGSATQTLWALATRLSDETDTRSAHPAAVALETPAGLASTSPTTSAVPALKLSPPRVGPGVFDPPKHMSQQNRGASCSSGPRSDARRQELLQQGKQRWEQYRERQSALEQFTPASPLS